MTDKQMDDDELAAIAARVEAATPGPWHHHAAGSQAGPWDFTVDAEDPKSGEWFTVAYTDAVEGGDHNGRFIAHARSDVPALLAEIERLREGIRQGYEDTGPHEPITRSSHPEAIYWCDSCHPTAAVDWPCEWARVYALLGVEAEQAKQEGQ